MKRKGSALTFPPHTELPMKRGTTTRAHCHAVACIKTRTCYVWMSRSAACSFEFARCKSTAACYHIFIRALRLCFRASYFVVVRQHGINARHPCNPIFHDRTFPIRRIIFYLLLASARTQETAIRNFAVEHREPGVLAGLTDARVQWPAHRHERDLLDRPPTPAR